ncbi:GNAT family N-acetyltransferase [Aerobium aerolatum]|uniref:Acetyltransferase (GNAT) family protein n=1 Tax=Aquamicrobium aerolatum DSM 21857 TaxID=1121003 RepID=A0A1I3ISL9_9HYPH|nr:GNAT family N-acetyltransferase [Aquamicrobium aerolatum]SFI50919.1 Acetyltransferase (GNAT) family protein [Aquamicrobium aerolatum DSM 21857]
MASNHQIDISLIRLKDARDLAPLLAAYTQALKRGAPRRPDEYYAETLLQDRTAEVMGARLDGALVGFAIFTDLPDPLSGMRLGQLDHLYVHHDHRKLGIAKALVDVLSDQAEERSWVRLALNAPRQPEDGRKLYEQIAVPADWTAHVIRYDDN